MRKLASAAALLGVVLVGSATAQEFKGAEVSAELLTFSEGDDIVANNYRGSVEFGVMGTFGVAADLSFYDFEDGDGVRNVTLHAMYDAFAFGTVGGFYARDTAEDADAVNIFGVEGGTSFGAAGVEGYLGFGEDEDENFTIFGFDGAFDVTPGISVTASGAALDVDGGGLSRLSIGGEYRFGDAGPAVYAEVGRVRVGDDTGLGASTGFIGIGGRIAIGPNQGTTFESRGLTEVLGSF
jgi:hypothetical protein